MPFVTAFRLPCSMRKVALLPLRCNAAASETAVHFDQRFTSDRGRSAHGLHFSVAILALADISDSLSDPAMMGTKRARKMKICPVRLRLRWRETLVSSHAAQ
jgi:hypothetical protein